MLVQATPFDLESLWNLKQALVTEESKQWSPEEELYPIPLVDYNSKEAFARERLALIYNPNFFYALVKDSSGLSQGYVLASVANRAGITPQVALVVHEMYVAPAFRRLLVDSPAKQIDEATKAWASSHSASVIEISSIGAAKQIKKWTRKGYKVFRVELFKEL